MSNARERGSRRATPCMSAIVAMSAFVQQLRAFVQCLSAFVQRKRAFVQCASAFVQQLRHLYNV
jgi:hypothetical protein